MLEQFYDFKHVAYKKQKNHTKYNYTNIIYLNILKNLFSICAWNNVQYNE